MAKGKRRQPDDEIRRECLRRRGGTGFAIVGAGADLMHMGSFVRMHMAMFVETRDGHVGLGHGSRLACLAHRFVDDGAHGYEAAATARLTAEAAIDGARRPRTFLAVD